MGLLDWKTMTANLRQYLGSVNTAVTPDSLLPLPGTANIDYDPPVQCAICEEESSWIRYSVEEIRDFLNEQVKVIHNRLAAAGSREFSSEQKEVAGTPVIYNPTVADLSRRKVPVNVVEAVFSGKLSPSIGFESESQGAQFNRDVWISQNLLARNFTREEVKAVFRSNPLGCGDRWVQARYGEKYLETIITAAEAQINDRHGSAKGKNTPFTVDSMPPGYKLGDDGSVLLITPSAKEGSEPKTTLVSNTALRISEIRENIDTGQISVVISYNYLGKNRSTAILRSQMCNARSLVTILSGEGAPVTSNNARFLVSYLAAYENAFAEFIPRKQVTSRFGRTGAAKKFFLPGLSSAVEFAPNGAGDMAIYKAYSAREGTLRGWVDIMNRLEQGNYMIPQIAVAASFVPPLQKLLQIPNFILDIFGNTSSGKSTTLKLAASVYGRPFDPDSLIHQWMNTKLAVEQIAGMCSELPIYLDDAQHCSDDLKRTVIYMIANGKGKGRSSGRRGIQETMSWQTIALSTSEEPLYQSSPHEGVRGRLLPVGGIVPPFPPNSSAVVQSLEKAISQNHGFAGETFIRHLNGWKDKDWLKWQNRYTLLRSELTLNSSSDIVARVSGYIAAIGVASEIACPLLGLKFKPDVMVAWLLNHIQEQQSNQNLVLLALRALAEHYLSNLNSFAGTGSYQSSRHPLQGVSKKGEYIGFMRAALDAVFSKRKWNQTMLLNKMAAAGVLHSTEADRHTKKISIQGVKYRLVCIKWSAILPDDSGL
jgi:uncharacterized protein (DUF927 family)